jgi:hypothetical protein
MALPPRKPRVRLPRMKAEAILSELPEHPLNKLGRELEQYL